LAWPTADAFGRPRSPGPAAGDDALGSLRALRNGSASQRGRGAVARLRTATATSAGGIVVRYEAGRPQFVAGSRRRERDGRTWTLPKGTPMRDETTEQTAIREVAEETGLEVRITGPLDFIEYTFVKSGTRIRKTVHYFMMEPVGGDLARHDHEFDQVRWVDFAEAASLLTFETERALVAHAADLLEAKPAERAS
jgi:8-oxo-dGTP pyrophosphatase MutT (NUDIX family)